MFPIAENLEVRNNQLESYLPIRKKNNDFDWGIVTGLVLSQTLKQRIQDYTFETFTEECKYRLNDIIEEPKFWPVLERMYFSSKDVFSISPLFLLFRAQFKGTGKVHLGADNMRLAALFQSLLGELQLATDLQDKLTFIEQEILTILRRRLSPIESSPIGQEQPYLPYLATVFQEDMTFLATQPQYLLRELQNTLKLYAFTYCAQLALNLSAWRHGEPKPKPLFFILDTEKACSERADIQKHGFKLFAKEAERLFPILSALEVLQCGESKRPLWKVYADIMEYQDPEAILRSLNAYQTEFLIDRKLPERAPSTSLDEALQVMLDVAFEQFRDKNTTRGGVNKDYLGELESRICADFVQPRGRAGRVLVLNQDQLLLLTNLAIGAQEKLRLHELMSAFERRGFYLDNQSRQALALFYERMGNVERMSDSGDAVYVRKTI